MGELELVGLHEDGEHLVLAGPDGQRFRLRIDEPLRAAVRRDRPQLEQLRAAGAGALTPREIQARIRAGATAAEVAHTAGIAVEQVRRYEGPVLAEREYVAEQARTARIGHETGSPALGDLVADRLAARGVDVASLSWDAAREGTGPWLVLARFAVGDARREARWTFDLTTRAVTADEDEARWLSETELDDPARRRHLAAVRDVVFDLQRGPTGGPATGAPPTATTAATPADRVTADPDAAAAVGEASTAALLDELGSRRGRRQPVEPDGEVFEGFGPQRAFDLGNLGARPEQPAPDATPPTGTTTVAEEPPAGRQRRRARAKVPSWDEIVFGAKPE